MKSTGVNISIHGGVGDVHEGIERGLTGSEVLITVERKNGDVLHILNDAGMESMNYDPSNINGTPLPHHKEIDACVVTHAHADHWGRIPAIQRRTGKNFPIICTKTTQELLRILGNDAARIQTGTLERLLERVKEEKRTIRGLISRHNTLLDQANNPRKDKKNRRPEQIGDIEGIKTQLEELGCIFTKHTVKTPDTKKMSNREKKRLGSLMRTYNQRTKKQVRNRGYQADTETTIEEIAGELERIGWHTTKKEDPDYYSSDGLDEWKEEEIEEEKSRLLFDEGDIRKMLQKVEGHNYKKWIEIADGVRIKMYNSAHVLGSATIVYEIDGKNGEKVHIGMTGDVGRYDELNRLGEPSKIEEELDFLLIEGTYGDKEKHTEPKEVRSELRRIVEETFREKRTLLIPVFQLQRMQDIIIEVGLAIKDYTESKQGQIDNEIISRKLEDERIQEIERKISTEKRHKIWLRGIRERKRRNKEKIEILKKRKEKNGRSVRIYDGGSAEGINGIFSKDDKYAELESSRFEGVARGKDSNPFFTKNSKTPAFVIASGGMMQNGSSVHKYLGTVGSDPNATMLFVGYQGEGTFGRRITEGGGEEVYCEVEQLSFSGHASASELKRFIRGVQFKTGAQILINHADISVPEKLAKGVEGLPNVQGEVIVNTASIGGNYPIFRD